MAATCRERLTTGELCGREVTPPGDLCAWCRRYGSSAPPKVSRPKVQDLPVRPRCRRIALRAEDLERLRAEAARLRWRLPAARAAR